MTVGLNHDLGLRNELAKLDHKIYYIPINWFWWKIKLVYYLMFFLFINISHHSNQQWYAYLNEDVVIWFEE